MTYVLAGKRVFVPGHGGMLGRALVRRLAAEGCEVLTADRGLDLRRQAEVEAYMDAARPQAVFAQAALQGGVLANQTRPGEFLYDNLMIAAHLMEAARRAAVEKLLFVGSAAAYPVDAPQPVREEALWGGPYDPSHLGYGAAKLAGVVMAQAYRRQYGCDFVAAMPGNIYGPGARTGTAAANVVPALLTRFHEAKLSGAPKVEVWGTGAARREFLHVDDCADALVAVMTRWSGETPVNVGPGEDVSIADLAGLVAETVGYEGEIAWDASKPEGAPRRRLDVARLFSTGWRPRIGLREGLARTYAEGAPWGL